MHGMDDSHEWAQRLGPKLIPEVPIKIDKAKVDTDTCNNAIHSVNFTVGNSTMIQQCITTMTTICLQWMVSIAKAKQSKSLTHVISIVAFQFASDIVGSRSWHSHTLVWHARAHQWLRPTRSSASSRSYFVLFYGYSETKANKHNILKGTQITFKTNNLFPEPILFFVVGIYPGPDFQEVDLYVPTGFHVWVMVISMCSMFAAWNYIDHLHLALCCEATL